MMMKRIGMMLLMMAAMWPAAQAQTEENDSLVRVIGWFCTGDTLEYRYSAVRGEVAEGDTTVAESAWDVIRICVKDSTKKGYVMEYTTLKSGLSDTTSLRGRMALAAVRASQGQKVLFSTDELGEFQEILNWKEVRSRAMKNASTVVDLLYKDYPMLYSVQSKTDMLKAMQKNLEKQFGTKEKTGDLFLPIKMIFLHHGRQFEPGRHEMEGDGEKVTFDITRGKLDDEEDSYDSEYQIYQSVSQTAADGTKMEYYYNYRYFDDGWPRDFLVTIVDEKDGKQTLVQQSLQWISKAWK